MKLRISIAALMGVVAAVAFSITALRCPTQFCASAIVTLMVGMFCTASLGVLLVRGRRRPFWMGYVLFGFVGFLMSRFGPGHLDGSRVSLPPFTILSILIEYADLSGPPSDQSPFTLSSIFGGWNNWKFDPENSLQIGDSLGLIAFSLIGGLIGRLFASRPGD